MLLLLFSPMFIPGCSVGPGGPDDQLHITSICEIQAYDDSGLSPLNGEYVTTRGVVTAPLGSIESWLLYIEEQGCGVAVSLFDTLGSQLVLGDSIRVSGQVGEATDADDPCGFCTGVFCGDASDVVVLSTGNQLPDPADMDLARIATEENEGRLVRARGAVASTDYETEFVLQDTSGAMSVYRGSSQALDFSFYSPGDSLEVTGIVYQDDCEEPYLEGYRIRPRSQEDLRALEQGSNPLAWPN